MTLFRKVLLGVLAGLVISAIITLAVRNRKPAPTGPAIIAKTETLKTERPLSFGNGVCYFHCRGHEFAASLSNFLSSDNTLKVKIITADASVDGNNLGFFVIFENK